MALAKERKLNPRQLATDVLAKLDVADWCDKVEIAGAGFLNPAAQTIRARWMRLEAAKYSEHPLCPTDRLAAHYRRWLFPSSPNVAKPMHVGHIRSTGIGDALQRILRLLGHRVVTDNHIGDWGTQFGKLLLGWKQTSRHAPRWNATPSPNSNASTKLVNADCDANPARLEEAKQELVKLQAGDAENTAITAGNDPPFTKKQFDEI